MKISTVIEESGRAIEIIEFWCVDNESKNILFHKLIFLYNFFYIKIKLKILHFWYYHLTELKDCIWALNDTAGQNLGFYELQNHSNNDCFKAVYLRKKDTWLENFICLHFLRFSYSFWLLMFSFSLIVRCFLFGA